jgi:hypothetical protein
LFSFADNQVFTASSALSIPLPVLQLQSALELDGFLSGNLDDSSEIVKTIHYKQQGGYVVAEKNQGHRVRGAGQDGQGNRQGSIL